MSRLQQQAIVIGDSFNNTLGLIRSLGEAKVDIVLLLVGDDRLFVSKSRYLKKSQIFQMETIDDCLPTLLRIADKTKQQTIICTNDIATQYIDEYETTLCSLYITPMKGRHLGNLLNKDEQCRLAETQLPVGSWWKRTPFRKYGRRAERGFCLRYESGGSNINEAGQ